MTALRACDDISVQPMCEQLNKYEFPKQKITQQGTVLLYGSMENVEHMLKKYGITCRYNMVNKEVEINIPGSRFTNDNALNAAVNTVINLCINNDIPKGDVPGHLMVIADKNAYNPVLEWIESKPWDGVDRVEEVIRLVEVKPGFEEVRDLYMKKWLMCAVGMLENGVNGLTLDCEGILVFQGAQGIGKTRWFKQLAGAENSKFIRDGLDLDLSNKDSKITFSSHWMVELGELDSTFKKSEISALKAFVTSCSDRFRKPFDRVDSILPRRTTMFASVNPVEFLQDDTGNRRFWSLPVTSISIPDDFNAQQFWAQVKEMLESKGGAKAKPWYITEDYDKALRDTANEMFLSTDPILEEIMSMFDPSAEREYLATATMVCQAIGEKSTRQAAVKVSSECRRLFGEPVRRKDGRYYSVPAPRGMNSQMIKAIGLIKNV